MSQQMLLIVMIMRIAIGIRGSDFPSVNVHAVLAFFRKNDSQSDKIALNPMTDVFAQLLLLHPVFMQRCHEICKGSSHAKCDFQIVSLCKDQSIFVADGDYKKIA